MSRFQKWLATLPTTNLQTFVGLALSAITVLVLLVALLAGIELQEAIVNSVLFFLGAMLGLSVGQFAAKRWSTDVAVMNTSAAIESNTALRTSTVEKTTERTTETGPGAGDLP